MSYTDVIRRFSLWLLLAAWGLTAVAASAATPDKDKDKNPRQAQQNQAASKNAAGACTVGRAAADLDVNNVRARVFNTGSLFYSHTDDSRYEVPKGGDIAPIFASGVWIGGMVGSELRMAAATYGQFGEDFEFFPGPIDAAGNAPNDCSTFDRIYKVSRTDLVNLNTTGQASRDITDWPWQLGAPVTDGDGNPNNYNLAGGDRPQLIGDMMTWWVMNDAGGQHLTTLTNPIGLEVQATAFAFSSSDALNNTTFYKFKMIYKPKQNVPLTDAWIGLWSDPDLGNASDDYVGSDTTLGLGYVYNGDPVDETSHGYGNRPPALGYDFFQGPLVDDDGHDNNLDGDVDEPGERLKMTRFVYYNNVNGAVNGNPDGAEDFYGYLKGLWTDNSQITYGGDGVGGTVPAPFMFPSEPPAYWSEDNVDGRGGKNQPADRRFLMSTGPFTMQPGDVQEIVFGIVWSQTRDRIGSIKQLKADDILAQGAFNFNFQLPPPPNSPELVASELDGQVVLTWTNKGTSNNFLNQYDEESPFLSDANASDQTYTFEGYKIYQYPSLQTAPEDGVLIATMDVANGITTVVDNAIDPTTGAPIRRVSAQGSDTGVQDFFVVEKDYIRDEPLRNFTEYYFGIQAYAYNEASDPKIRQSPIVRMRVVPQSIENRNGGTLVNAESGEELAAKLTAGVGEGKIIASIADPSRVTGQDYDVKFYTIGGAHGDSLMTYDLVNKATGQVLLNGREYFQRTGKAMPQGSDLFVQDGLSFGVSGPDPDFRAFLVTANAGGKLATPEMGTYCFNANGFPCHPTTGATNGTAGVQQKNSRAVWGIVNAYVNSSNGTRPFTATYEDFMTLTTSNAPLEEIIPFDYELRFTANGAKGFTHLNKLIDVPFEVWNIGVGTPDDPKDDYQMFPRLRDYDKNDRFNLLDNPSLQAANTTAWTADHDFSGGANDPYSDAIFIVQPGDMTPGSAGYNAIVSNLQAKPDLNAAFAATNSHYLISWWGLGLWNGGNVADRSTYLAQLPEVGTVFRIVTTKPIAKGDVYTLSTRGLGTVVGVDSLANAGLEKIAIVPNPYRGSSSYDVSPFQDEARITNLPVGSRIRVFAINGTLIFEDTQRSNDGFYRWDLTTNDGLPIASGMYLIHVDVPEVGERVLKFGVVKKRVQLDVF